jgi:surface carbohydrate biosynthesis protein (TIGR04326 family)
MLRWDLLDTRPGVAARILTRLLAMRWRQGPLLRDLETNSVLEHHGFDLRQWLLDARDSQTLNGGFQNVYLYELVRHAVEEGAPDVVLYKDEFYASGRAVSAAVSDETASWAFEHGPMNKTYMVYINDGQWVGPVGERRADFMPTPDLFLCYGEFAREIVTQRGYPEERVLPIGSFRHDPLFRQSGERVDPERLGLPADRHILTVCGQLPKEIPHWLRCLVGGIRLSGRDCHVVVKPHPRYDVRDLCTRMFEELDFADYSFEMDRLHDLMKASDVVLTGNSTTGLESLALGVPLIVFMDPGGFEQIPYVEEGAGLSAHDPESMRDALELLLGQDDPLAERRDQFLRRHLSPSAGHAIDEFLRLYAETFGTV